MKTKLFYLSLIIALIAGSFTIGLYMGLNTDTSSNISYAPDFDLAETFLPFIMEECPETNVPDWQNCSQKLAESTMATADSLASSLSYSHSLIPLAAIKAIKNVRDVQDKYIESICNLDGLKIYGSSGGALEFGACKFYFADQYLKLLRGLEKNLPKTVRVIYDSF